VIAQTMAGNKDMKRQLPAVSWQSDWPDGQSRKSATATPTGLYMIDVDGVEDPLDMWTGILKNHSPLIGTEIFLAHITPSGHGLRLVCHCVAGLSSIAENQRRMAGMLGIKIDEVCKDLARLSFIVSDKNVLYINDKVFESHPETMLQQDQPAAQSQKEQAPKDGANTSNDDAQAPEQQEGTAVVKTLFPKDYEGVPYDDIVEMFVRDHGGEPAVGGRNNRLYSMAKDFRYICDFNPEFLYKVLPGFGLPESEKRHVIESAINATRGAKVPYALYKLIERMKADKDESEENAGEEADDADTIAELPPLPPIIEDFVKLAPADFKAPTIMALLPILGTLGSKLRGEYIDGKMQAPNFFTLIEAPQASGKSFTRRLFDICMADVKESDRQELNRERVYMEALKAAKNKKEQPDDPKVVVRIIPASVSIAKLLKRLDQSQGLHLFSYLEELDTLTKSNSAGAWSQKSDIYRNAYDNAPYGQDYMSDNSYSATVNVFYNMLVSGTPRAVKRFFKDPEDGLCSRVIMVQLKSQFGAKMPIFHRFNTFVLKKVAGLCAKMNQELGMADGKVANEHELDMNFLNSALDEWLEQERITAIENNDHGRDIFRRRCAVNGFRAGMLAFYLYGEKKNKTVYDKVRQFALWVARESEMTLMAKYDKEINDMAEESSAKHFRAVSLFPRLSAKFSSSELEAIITAEGLKTPKRQIIYNWKRNNLIEEISKDNYRKITQVC
jgi:hypothetical protein